MVTGEQLGPVSIQLCKCCINLLCCLELFQDFVSPILADYIRSNELLILRIFTVAKNENQITGFSGGKCEINLWLAIGYQPLATELPALFFFTASGKAFPLLCPRKASLLVSYPSTGQLTLKKL